jgi:hypothetical protein
MIDQQLAETGKLLAAVDNDLIRERPVEHLAEERVQNGDDRRDTDVELLWKALGKCREQPSRRIINSIGGGGTPSPASSEAPAADDGANVRKRQRQISLFKRDDVSPSHQVSHWDELATTFATQDASPVEAQRLESVQDSSAKARQYLQLVLLFQVSQEQGDKT